MIDGELKGDPNCRISGINSINKARQSQITFSAKKTVETGNLQASALIVPKGSDIKFSNLIYVDEPYLAFATLLEYFNPTPRFNDGVSPQAFVHDSAILGNDVCVGQFSSIGAGSSIGASTDIHANVTIYPGVKIGENCRIYSNVVIRESVTIGNNVIIQPGAVIGADGFGFTRTSSGIPVKIPQKGKVIIGDNCEIGANTCIDRATIEETVLEDYVKLDNLVQVGHNVKIGKLSALSAQTGISGSTEIGKNVIMGGQVGLADHISIADNVMVAAKSGVTGSVAKEGEIVSGYPHQDIRKWRKSQVILRNIDKYIEKIKELEKKFKHMEEQ